jgi:hypothetical protein
MHIFLVIIGLEHIIASRIFLDTLFNSTIKTENAAPFC